MSLKRYIICKLNLYIQIPPTFLIVAKVLLYIITIYIMYIIYQQDSIKTAYVYNKRIYKYSIETSFTISHEGCIK